MSVTLSKTEYPLQNTVPNPLLGLRKHVGTIMSKALKKSLLGQGAQGAGILKAEFK